MANWPMTIVCLPHYLKENFVAGEYGPLPSSEHKTVVFQIMDVMPSLPKDVTNLKDLIKCFYLNKIKFEEVASKIVVFVTISRKPAEQSLLLIGRASFKISSLF